MKGPCRRHRSSNRSLGPNEAFSVGMKQIAASGSAGPHVSKAKRLRTRQARNRSEIAAQL